MRTRSLAVTLTLLLALITGLAWSKDDREGIPLPVPDAPPPTTGAIPGVEAIRSDRIQSDLGYLCSDTLEGRGSGAKGGWNAGNWLARQLSWMGLEPAGSNGEYFQPFRSNGKNMRNVLATVPGQGSNEVVVIGAHYDHLGFGYQRGAFGPSGQIHNGADDNGSGTSALLAIARAFAASGRRYPRRVVFAFFDGEERGLLGSKHWVGSPTISGKVVLMINLDMVGRLRGKLQISHNGGDLLRSYMSAANKSVRVPLTRGRGIKPDSDHYPFYRSRVPVLIPFTGFHDNYHRPSDDLERINVKGIEQVARLSYGVAVLAASDTRRARVGAITEFKVDPDAIQGCHRFHYPPEEKKTPPGPERRYDGLLPHLDPH